MPSLGADMTSGKLVSWHVKPGDVVKRGDIVATVDTSKAEIDVEIFEDGTIGELLVAEGERVPVGSVLATVNGAPQAAAEPAPVEPVPAPAAERRPASPLARRTAADLGVPLGQVTGSGPGGAILVRDVGASAAPSEPQPDRALSMREAIAAAMARSKREIPHYYLGTTIDMEAALTWLSEQNAQRPVAERVLPAVLMLKAVAIACRELPAFNGYWVEGAFRPGTGVHLGVAISLRTGGLVAPAIHDADRLDLDALMAALRDLVRRARSGGLRSSELTDPTVTVTNLGDGGVPTVYGVIYPPQVALVGFGSISERPWAAGGMLGARRAVDTTLAADHRATDGMSGASFLKAVDRLLQTPEQL
ncbi:MAG TPA: dihydrolipoamide acetyltransferase family protein [Solirubrobacteraceae bacterium]|nr:dihydrolipoamide acetyltransferase family protein [Solirubrobacteraceae bacterium]